MRVIVKSARLAVIAAALSVAPAQAEETVVVTGARIPTPLDRFAGAATVITARDIKLHQYKDITDALAGVPGLHVASVGGVGAQTSVFMRGAESNHVLVLIDGVEVTDPGSGSFAFEHLQLNDVERIEVLRGPYSAQYGSEGIGGVINVVTKRGEGAPGASARVETGSFATEAAALSLSGRHARVNFSFGGAWLQTDGESLTPRRLRDGRGGERDGYDNLDVKAAVGVEAGAASRVDFSFGYVEADVEFDGNVRPFERPGLKSSVSEKRYAVRWSGESAQRVWRPSLQGAYYGRRSAESGRGERTKFEWRNDLFFSDAMKFVVGAETELEQMRGRSQHNARTNAVYMQAWFEPFDALSLSGGWRNDDPDDFGSDRNWQAAAAYAVGESGVRLRASYGTAFKAPTLSDRFSYFPDFNFRGNPGLEPESSRGREFGVEQTLSIGGADAGWGLTHFDNRIRDLIGASADGTTLQNIASAHIEGVESFAFLEIAGGVSVRLDYTVMRAYDGDHQRLRRRPLSQAGLAAHWVNPAWSVAAKLDYVGPQHDLRRDDFSRVTRGGYALAHISARRRINEAFALFARVNNVFDKDYEPVDGYAGRGFEFHAGVEADL